MTSTSSIIKIVRVSIMIGRLLRSTMYPASVVTAT
jgi:hypothetical protein